MLGRYREISYPSGSERIVTSTSALPGVGRVRVRDRDRVRVRDRDRVRVRVAPSTAHR